MLKGQWLKELGFEIGNYVSVTCENDKLVITPDDERAAMAEAEAAFMEREIISIKRKFDREVKASCTVCSKERSEVFVYEETV